VIDPLTTAWFPDLRRVDAGPARRQLWLSAYGPVLGNRTYWLIAGAVQVVAQIVLTVPLTQYARRAGFYGPAIGWGLPVLVAALACVVIIWLVRRWITRSLREELNRRGLPTCLACGYDLTGNVSGTCPECGTTISQT
jgi:hypothetical protein